MTVPEGYTINSVRVPAPTDDWGQPAVRWDDQAAQAMIGQNITVRLHGVEVAAGPVTNVKIIEDGAALWVTSETSGRRCFACSYVYPESEASRLVRAEVVQQRPGNQNSSVQNLPPWAPVCSGDASCLYRRMDEPPPNDGEPVLPAGWYDAGTTR